MAAKKKEKEITADDMIVYDEWIVPDKVRVLIDASEVLEDTEAYQRQLMLYRGIPQRADAFKVDDSNIDTAMNIFSHIKDQETREEKALKLLKDHYERLADQCQAYGFMLASTKTNEFDNEPKPYTKDFFESKSLPGIESIPDPMPDLSNLVEYRLKQLLDLLAEYPGSLSKLQAKARTLPITINQRLGLGRKPQVGEST